MPSRTPTANLTAEPKGYIRFVEFTPDGRILAIGDSDGILLYVLESQFSLATILLGIAIRALEFSPDGETLAWSAADGEIGFLRTTRTVPSH